MNHYVVVAGKRNQPEPDDHVNNNNDHKPLPKSFHQVRANATSSVWDSGIKELTDPGKEHVDAEYEVILFHLFFLALFVACPVIVGKLGTQ
jgi:hypothetical protein